METKSPFSYLYRNVFPSQQTGGHQGRRKGDAAPLKFPIWFRGHSCKPGIPFLLLWALRMSVLGQEREQKMSSFPPSAHVCWPLLNRYLWVASISKLWSSGRNNQFHSIRYLLNYYVPSILQSIALCMSHSIWSPSNPMRSIISLSPFYRWRDWGLKRGSGVVKLCSYNMTKLLIQIFSSRTFWRPQRDLSFLKRMVGWGIYPLVPIPQWLRIFPRRVNPQYSQALFKLGPNSFLKPLDKMLGQKSERHPVHGFDSFQQGLWGQLENIWGYLCVFEGAWKCVVCANTGQYYSQLICGYCHEIKRHLLLGRKPVTNLDSVLKSRDIILSTKIRIVKVLIFPAVMYGCESWTIKKAECWRTDAFELWCWSRLLRVPLTARRSNQSILKEISPGCSLDGLMLKLKL